MTDLASLLSNPQLITAGVGLLYSLAGYLEGVRTGSESFDVVKFGKTIVTFLLTASIITPTQAGGYNGILDALTPIGGAFVIDQVTSKLLTAHRAKPPTPPAPTPTQ